jgi:hypothetical protein
VLAECVLDELIIAEGLISDRFIYHCVDENVWAQTAQNMLRRAVSYAGGMLDYFFRGTLDFTVSPGAGGQSVLKITNTSAETMEGKLTLYADNFSDVRGEVSGAFFDPLTLGPDGEPDSESPELTFTPPSEVKAYILVFEGRLGNEVPAPHSNPDLAFPGAVVGKVQPSLPVSFTTQIRGKVSGNFIIDKPAGTTNGDLLLIALADDHIGPPGSFVPPAGWTWLESSETATAFALYVYYKVAGASEPAAYDWGNPHSAKRLLGILLRISGNDTTSPIDDSAENNSNIFSSDTAVTPSVTTTENCGRVFRFVYAWSNASDIIPPSNHTEHVQISSSGLTDMLEVASFAPCPIGATGTVNFAISPGPALWSAITVAVKKP